MKAAAENDIITESNYSQELIDINFGILPENNTQKKNNHKHNLSGRSYTKAINYTFELIMQHDHTAACLWHTMISLPEHWHYRIPDLARRINVCETTCKTKMNILIKLGVVYRYRNPDSTTEYEVFQIPQHNLPELQGRSKPLTDPTYYNKNKEIYTKQQSNNNLVSAKPMPKTVVVPENKSFEKQKKHDTVQTSCIDDTSKLDPRSGSEPESGPPNSGNPCKPLHRRLRNQTKLNLTQQLNSSGLPDSLDNQQKTSDIKAVDQIPSHKPSLMNVEKRIKVAPGDRRAPGIPKISPEIKQKINQVLDKIEPANRNKIPIPVLKAKIDDFSVDQHADRCIYAIQQTYSENQSVEHHKRRIEGYLRSIYNNNYSVKSQTHYCDKPKEPIIIKQPDRNLSDFKRRMDEHYERIKKYGKNQSLDTDTKKCKEFGKI